MLQNATGVGEQQAASLHQPAAGSSSAAPSPPSPSHVSAAHAHHNQHQHQLHHHHSHSTLADNLRALRDANSSSPALFSPPEHLRAGLAAASSSRRKPAPSPLQHSSSSSSSTRARHALPSPSSPDSSSLVAPRSPRERLQAFLSSDSLHVAGIHHHKSTSPAQTAPSTSAPPPSTATIPAAAAAAAAAAAPPPHSHGHGARKTSAPLPTLHPPTPAVSPPITPTFSSAMSVMAVSPDTRPPLRNPSMDSTVSSASAAAEQRSTPSAAARRPSVDRQNTAPEQDMDSFLAAFGGNAAAALAALWKEKQSASAHNAQLWRLVEKQRAMILGLNKDLEKALKDKERYRKKLKEHLAQEPPLPNGLSRVDSGLSRAHSQSPAPSENAAAAERAERSESELSLRADGSSFRPGIKRTDSDPQSPVDKAAPLQGSSIVSPPDPANHGPAPPQPSMQRSSPGDGQPSHALQSSSSVQNVNVNVQRGESKRRVEQARQQQQQQQQPPLSRRTEASTQPATLTAPSTNGENHNNKDYPTTPDLRPAPLSIRSHDTANALPTVSFTAATPLLKSGAFAPSPPPNSAPAARAPEPPRGASGSAANTVPSPTHTRKAPPAPLNLSKDAKTAAQLQQAQRPSKDESDSDEIVETTDGVAAASPGLKQDRGRRKTREEDDMLREAIAKRSEEERSLSKKAKKSKSKGTGSAVQSPSAAAASSLPQSPPLPLQQPSSGEQQERKLAAPPPAFAAGLPASPRLPPQAAGSINALLSPANSDSSGAGAGRGSALSLHGGLMSPGLPASPRPMSNQSAGQQFGLPTSPRASKQSYGTPPLSPPAGGTAMQLSPRAPTRPIPLPATANAPRAGTANLQEKSHPVRLEISPAPLEREDSPGSAVVDEIYRGLVDDRYPGLLLPPNALPSIDVRVFSSRMRPSRHSMLFAKPEEDPVFQLGIYSHATGTQLWRVEKTTSALGRLHQVLALAGSFKGPQPERGLFSGHAPAKIDARRVALDAYFGALLDANLDERSAVEVCRFFSDDVIEPEHEAGQAGAMQVPQQQESAPAATPPKAAKARKEGFLTKRGKNFGGWKARYFVLADTALTYYDAVGGNEIGRIKLANAQIGKQQSPRASSSSQAQARSESADSSAAEDNEYRHAFLILEPKRKDEKSLVRHVLCAESDAERDAWVEALLQHVDGSGGGGGGGGGDARAQSLYSQQNVSIAQPPRVSRKLVPPPSDDAATGRSRSRGKDSKTSTPEQEKADMFQSMSYDDMVPQNAPVRGPSRSGMPSPPLNGSFGAQQQQQQQQPAPAPTRDPPQQPMQTAPPAHPIISGPSGGMKIEDASMWGNKAPAARDKKRSIFGFRGRAGSDLEAKQVGPNAAAAATSAPGHVVFGVPLQEAVEYTQPRDADTPLPAVVYRCLEYLRVKGAAMEEGIFRLSGSNVTIRALRERFNTEADIELTRGEYYDVHAVASLLKLYLRELPSSVLTRELHLDFLKGLDLDDKPSKLIAFNALCHRLPPQNFALLRALSQFLIEIVRASETNKMNVRNVGIVFAPTLNIPAPLIYAFISDFDAIFGPAVSEEQASPVRDAMHGGGGGGAGAGAGGGSEWDAIRSPRKQMFGELPTPAYNQQSFQSVGGFAPVVQQQHLPATRQLYAAGGGQLGAQGPADYYSQQQQQQQQQDTASYASTPYSAAVPLAPPPPPPPPPPPQGPPPQAPQQMMSAKKARRESNVQMLMAGYTGPPPGVGGSLAHVLSEQRKGSYASLRSGSGSREGRGSPARR